MFLCKSVSTGITEFRCVPPHGACRILIPLRVCFFLRANDSKKPVLLRIITKQGVNAYAGMSVNPKLFKGVNIRRNVSNSSKAG